MGNSSIAFIRSAILYRYENYMGTCDFWRCLGLNFSKVLMRFFSTTCQVTYILFKKIDRHDSNHGHRGV